MIVSLKNENRGKNKIIVYDIYATIVLFLSIFIFYLAYHEFSKVYYQIETNVIDNMADDVKHAFQLTITHIQQKEKLSQPLYLSFVLNLVQRNIGNLFQEKIIDLVYRELNNIKYDFTEKAKRQCLLNIQKLDISSTFIQKAFFFVSEMTLGLTAPTSTSLCISQTANEYTRIFVNNKMSAFSLYKTYIISKIGQIYSLTIYSFSLGISSGSYFIYRIKNRNAKEYLKSE